MAYRFYILMAGVFLIGIVGTADAADTSRISKYSEYAQQNNAGVVTGTTGNRTLRLMPPSPGTVAIIRSGFEGTTQVIGTPNPQSDDIVGADPQFPKPNDWEADLETHPTIGTVSIQYEGGTPDQRFVRVVDDPTKSGNHVLHFRINQANVVAQAGEAYKARAQMNIYNNVGLKKIHQKMRMYIPKDIQTMKLYPKSTGWVTTLAEFWNNGPWTGQPYPFRISLNVAKPNAAVGAPLNFEVHGQVLDPVTNKFVNVWEQTNKRIDLPVDQWVTVEYLVVEGRGDQGRFYMSITPDGKSTQLVFDIRNSTHHPDDPAPDGFAHYNPLKLYTSKAVIDFLVARGKSLQIYFDNFELWED